MATKTAQRPLRTRIIRMANVWARHWMAAKAAKERLDHVAGQLEGFMRRARMTSVDLLIMPGTVQQVISIKKVPTKRDIIRAFGSRNGELFWARLHSRVSTYLTLTNRRNARG